MQSRWAIQEAIIIQFLSFTFCVILITSVFIYSQTITTFSSAGPGGKLSDEIVDVPLRRSWEGSWDLHLSIQPTSYEQFPPNCI